MNDNKIVIAILTVGVCISAAIYFSGQKTDKLPSIAIPGITNSTTETVSPANETPTVVVSPTVEVDDFSPIAVAIGKELQVDPNTLLVTKTKQIDSYARGSVTTKGEETGGGQWWGVKENGVWKYIFAGQSYPKCSVIAAYQIPKALLDSCFDDATNNLKQL